MEEEYFNLGDLSLQESTMNQILNIEEEKTEDADSVESVELVKEEEGNEGESNLPEDQKEENKVKSEAPSTESTNDSSTFSVFANLLKEEGVFSLEEEEIGKIKTSEDLIEAVRKQIETSKFSNLSESQKRYLESIETGVPQAEFEILERQLNNLEKISDQIIEDDRQTRFDLIAYDWMAKGISKEKAVDLANRSLKLGTDVDDAKEARLSLITVKTKEYKESIISKQEEQKISLEKLKEEIDKKDFILKDVKQTPKQKQDLYNLLSTKVATDEQGQPINEFNKWRTDNKLEAEIILGAMYLQTNKFKDLGKILDVTKSKAAKQLEDKLRQNEASDTVNRNTSFGSMKNYEINI